MTALSLNDNPTNGDGGGDETVPRSIARVLDLFETVVDHGSCTLTEAAADVDLTPTTARRYLQALVVRGYVDRAPDGSYTPGPAIRAVAERLGPDDAVATLARRVQGHLDRLAAAAGESAYLGVVDGDSIVYVATAQSERAIRHVGWIGQRLPFAGTAIGAALAAAGGPVFRSGGLEPDISAVSHALPGEWEGRAAVSIVGPAHRFDDQTVDGFRAHVVATVAALADELRLGGSE